jgi:hypothetical protein
MTERTWEAIGRTVMIPSLGGIGLFKGKLNKPMWKTHLDTYKCQWDFNKGGF